jgi:signal peptidase II
MRSRFLRVLVVVLIVLVSVGFDQAAKSLARGHLQGKGTVHVAGNVLMLRYVENTGAFLSLGAGLPPALRVLSFIAFPVLVIAGMIVYLARKKESAWGILAGCALLVGGGCGNLIDRLLRSGHVGDYLILGAGPLQTGIFNLADLFVLAGCALLLFAPKKKPPRAGAETPAA